MVRRNVEERGIESFQIEFTPGIVGVALFEMAYPSFAGGDLIRYQHLSVSANRDHFPQS